MRNKLTAMICLGLMLCAAGCEVKEPPKIESQEIGWEWMGSMDKLCVGGHAFLRTRIDRGGSMTQMWELDPVLGAVPMRCEKPPRNCSTHNRPTRQTPSDGEGAPDRHTHQIDDLI